MIWSDRDVYTAAHVTAPVKEALRLLARRENKSMSALIFEAIQDKLEKEGIDVNKEEEKEEDVVLPFETH